MTSFETKIPEMRCEYPECTKSLSFPMVGNSVDFRRGTDHARMEGWKVWTESGTWHHKCKEHSRF